MVTRHEYTGQILGTLTVRGRRTIRAMLRTPPTATGAVMRKRLNTYFYICCPGDNRWLRCVRTVVLRRNSVLGI